MSSTWYYLPLSAEQVASGMAERSKEAFEEVFKIARGPRLMALFKRESDGGGLDLYFTPECGEYAPKLLHDLGCQPCGRPSLPGLQLLVGHHEITYYMP